MAETLIGKPKDDGPQALGSVITYLRRYALAAFAGVAPEDDDGERAEGRNGGVTKVATPTAVAPVGYADWLLDLETVGADGIAALKETWKKSKAEYRDHLTKTNNAAWEKLKARAELVPPTVPA
jgi:hypothetical protein